MSPRSPPPWVSTCSFHPVGTDEAAEKVLFVTLLCGFVRNESGGLKIRTKEPYMVNPVAPLVRIPITLVLFGLLVLSIVSIKNIVTTTFRGIHVEGDLYRHSPNCGAHSDSSEIDPALSPCQNVMATVIAKPQNTTSHFGRYRNYPTTHLLLTLQDVNGQSQTVGNIYQDMWNSIHIGDQVSVQIWRSQIHEVSVNGYSSPIVDKQEENNFTGHLWPWIVTALFSFSLIGILWRSGRSRAFLSPL